MKPETRLLSFVAAMLLVQFILVLQSLDHEDAAKRAAQICTALKVGAK